MAKYSAQLVAKSNENRNVTTTLSNVNPETAPAKIKQFAQALNALTTNTYNETNYIVTTNFDTEAPPVDTRPTPTLSVAVPTLSQINGNNTSEPRTITYTGDGTIYAYRKSGCLNVGFGMTAENAIVIKRSLEGASNPATGGTFILAATSTDNYKPVEVEYTIE